MAKLRHLVLSSLILSFVSLQGCNKSGSDSSGNSVQGNSANQTSTTNSPAQTYDPGTLIEARESAYNSIYVYKSGHNISLTFGVNQKLFSESLYNPTDDRELPALYTQFMTMSLIYPEKIESILEIGSGGGRTAFYLHRYLPNARVTSVELDPAVVEIAHKYFGVKDEKNFRIVTRDGRLFLANSKEKYDVILIDAYRGTFIPFHLLTKEFYQIVKAHLADGGVMAQNIEPSTMLFDYDVNTLHDVFSQVEFYDAWIDDKTGGNVVLIAFDGKPFDISALREKAGKCEKAYALRYDPRQMLYRRFTLRKVMNGDKPVYDVINQFGNPTVGIDENAKTLTDDFAPVESLKAIEKHNRKWTNR